MPKSLKQNLFKPDVMQGSYADPENPNDYEGEFPQKLRDLLDHEDERCARPIMEETLMINLGTEEDRRMIQIGSKLSSQERQLLVDLLQEFKDVFAWSYEDMPGIDTKIIQHRSIPKPTQSNRNLGESALIRFSKSRRK